MQHHTYEPCVLIARSVLVKNFYQVFDSWLDERPIPYELIDFDESISDMRAHADWNGELELLKRAMEVLLLDEQCDIERLAEVQTGFAEGKVREVVQYAYHKLWPDSDLQEAKGRVPVKFVEMTFSEWKEFKAEMRNLFSAVEKY